MDQIALLSVDLAGGWRLIGELIGRGFPVSAALWACWRGEESWGLYLELPTAHQPGMNAYGLIYPILREASEWGFDMFSVHAVAAGDAMTKAAAALAAPDRIVPFRGGSLGGVFVEGAIIYPPWRPDFTPVM